MRVAGIVHTIDVHGGVRRYFEMGNALVRAGHEFILFANTVHEKKPWMEFLGELRPYHEARTTSVDVMFTNAPECFPDLESARADVKVVLVVSKFNSHTYKQAWNRGGSKHLWIGVESNWNVGLEEIKGICIPGGINTDFFTAVSREEHKKLLVAFHSRFWPGRGIEEINAVANELNGAVKFIGYDAPGYPVFKGFGNAVDLRINDSQERLRETLQESDIVLSAMVTAGWNNNIAESMACGCVPVSTLAGVADLIDDGVNGFVVPDADFVSHTIDRIRQLDENRELLCGMQKLSLERVKKFTWVNFCERMIEEVKEFKNAKA
jgi:glycosyltransferase involved in cell wall biosynthesis